jgi:hypothetical protein
MLMVKHFSSPTCSASPVNRVHLQSTVHGRSAALFEARNRNPNVQRLIYQKVPVKVAADWDTSEIGNKQVDFVAHCGRSTGGDYIHTISAVDIATNWWEGQAIAVRSQRATKEGLSQMQPRFPFRILELHPDNDSALVNDLLWDWTQQERIRLSRSRPYKKNDNAWVEQKNWTHVRKVVGYRRFDTTSELRVLNEIYATLRLYKNFCLPTMRLKSKARVEGRIKRIYEKPCTPYERVMGSRQVDRKTKQKLRSIYEALNPAELYRRLTELRQQLEAISVPANPKAMANQLTVVRRSALASDAIPSWRWPETSG